MLHVPEPNSDKLKSELRKIIASKTRIMFSNAKDSSKSLNNIILQPTGSFV